MIFRVTKQYFYCETLWKHEEKQTMNSFLDMGWFNFFMQNLTSQVVQSLKFKNFAKSDISSGSKSEI